jgi:hypothetical protein
MVKGVIRFPDKRVFISCPRCNWGKLRLPEERYHCDKCAMHFTHEEGAI